MVRPLCTLIALLLTLSVTAASWDYRVACWNVENLFDTIPDPSRPLQEFTPDGPYHWDGRRYWYKQGQLSRVIAGLGGAAPCALVGLVEVENDSVLYDLTRRTSLARLGYEYIVTHSPDVRGINVALLYQPMLFAPFVIDSIRVQPPQGMRPTRDILHVGGLLPTRDTLDVFVVHLPSRRGGHQAADYRRRMAESLVQYADSLCGSRQHPLILMMGDYNADSSDKIFRRTFSGYRSLTAGLSGTYRYQREWSQIDHFLINGAFFERIPCEADIFRAPFLLRETPSGPTPNRTFLGTYYQGGYSDHLPIVLNLNLKNSKP